MKVEMYYCFEALAYLGYVKNAVEKVIEKALRR